MEELSLFVRYFLAGMIMSAGLSKMRRFEEHQAIVADYRMLPQKSVALFSRLEVASELLVGSFLLLGLFTKQMALACAGLLIVYTLAITVNLLRGRHEISCGCGGAAGNHALSWQLVLRNLLLIAAACWLFRSDSMLGRLPLLLQGEAFGKVFGLPVVTALFFAVISLLATGIVNEYRSVRRRTYEMAPEVATWKKH